MSGEKPQDIGALSPQYQTYEHQKCFIAYTEQAEWSDDLLSACQEVLSQPGFNLEPDYARRHFYPDVPLRQKALELIANARYGIYDLSYWQDEEGEWQTPSNVFIELGMAIALNRPTLLLRHAINRELELAECLKSVSGHILEFSGETTLKRALEKRLPQWVNAPPERDWWNRYCIFGNRVCEYREAHPAARQWGEKTLRCHISDSPDVDRDDFRGVVEEVLGRFSDVTFDYLDALPLAQGYDFLLCTYCQTVRSTPLAIYRITPHTLGETFIAIGMSIALEVQFDYRISKILLTENVRDVPSLLSGYEVVVARSDQDRKVHLRTFMPLVMQKVRESAWKPRPLPFVEVVSLESASLVDTGEALAESTLQLIQLGDDLVRTAQYESAIQSFRQAIEHDPTHVVAYQRLGQVLTKLERFQEAKTYLEQAVEVDPTNAATYHTLGRVLADMARYEEAQASFERAITLGPSSAAFYIDLSRVLIRMERLDAAEQAFKEAVKLEAANPITWSAYAQLLIRMNRFQEAEAILHRAIELAPDNASGYLTLGQVQAEMANYEGALDYYTKAIELRPDHAATYVSRGTVFRTLNRLLEAIADFERAVELDSENVLAYYNWACISSLSGDNSRSLELLQRALELDPSLIERARTDSDLGALRNDPTFRTLIHETQPEVSGVKVPSILLVENDSTWRQILIEVLETEGYTLHAASSYGEAIERLRTPAFDLVITESNLGGDRKSEGIMLVEYISRMEPRIPVIICTGFITIEEAIRWSREFSVVDVIEKASLKATEFRRTVASALAERYSSTP